MGLAEIKYLRRVMDRVRNYDIKDIIKYWIGTKVHKTEAVRMIEPVSDCQENVELVQ